jgi:chromosome segregation ATPase
MSDEPENLVLELLRGMRADMGAMRADMGAMRADMATKSELASLKSELKSDINSLRADIASDLLLMQARNDAETKATREQIVGLRRAVVEYHSAVIGHGVLISELEARMRRVEQHLNLPFS